MLEFPLPTGHSQIFHVITGHLKVKMRWTEDLAALDGTMVFLMGVSNLQMIARKLIEQERMKTPVAIINWATTPRQKTIEGTLSDIYDKARMER